MSAKNLWRPRYKERESQCASCPFLKGNDEQFGKIVSKLRQQGGLAKPATKRIIASTRSNLRMEVIFGNGDFICHATAYGPGMELQPPTEHRQCPGATQLKRALPQPEEGP